MPETGLLTTRRFGIDGDLLGVTLSDPARANALSPPLIAELTALYRRELREEGVRAVLLSGAGKNFSAGADLEHLRSLRDAGPEENLADSLRLHDLFHAVLRQEALTLALVHGACVAGGCGLATAHDFVIAAADSRFLYSEVRIGFVAALVATYLPLRLQRLRPPRAAPLPPVRRGAAGPRHRPRQPDGREASELPAAAEALAGEILANGSSESIARTKRLLLDVLGRPLDDAMQHAAEVNAAARATATASTGSRPSWRRRSLPPGGRRSSPSGLSSAARRPATPPASGSRGASSGSRRPPPRR